jgi:glycosyltransferase involved in cell wall biosynthesis
MTDKSLVSIIIPTFNEEKYIAACLKSLFNQTYQNIEVILVDDGSTDQTLEEVKKLENHRNFKVLTQNHLGPALARNKASKQARGEIIAFLDADMVFDKEFIKDLVTPIIENKYKGTFSKNEFVFNWDNIWAKCWNINLGLKGKRMIPEDYPDEGQDFRAIIKSEFLRVNGFNDTGYTDTWTLSEKLGFKPHVVEGANYYHNNPDNLKEIFIQAKWRAKRKYKLGLVGELITLVKVSLPASFLVGLGKSIKEKQINFLWFKIVYDLGQFLGILEKIFFGKLSK